MVSLWQHKVSVEPVRDASSRLADWNAAICRAFIESFADDVRKHFGYLPLHMANRVKEVRGVCVAPLVAVTALLQLLLLLTHPRLPCCCRPWLHRAIERCVCMRVRVRVRVCVCVCVCLHCSGRQRCARSPAARTSWTPAPSGCGR